MTIYHFVGNVNDRGQSPHVVPLSLNRASFIFSVVGVYLAGGRTLIHVCIWRRLIWFNFFEKKKKKKKNSLKQKQKSAAPYTYHHQRMTGRQGHPHNPKEKSGGDQGSRGDTPGTQAHMADDGLPPAISACRVSESVVVRHVKAAALWLCIGINRKQNGRGLPRRDDRHPARLVVFDCPDHA
jgi:hypothetical protein